MDPHNVCGRYIFSLYGHQWYESQASHTKDVSAWNEALHITGGKLEPTKTSYLEVDWDFNQRGEPSVREPQMPQGDPVQLETPRGSIIINKTSPSVHPKEFKSLGVRTPGDLDDRYEYLAFIQKTKKFIKCLRACPLRPYKI